MKLCIFTFVLLVVLMQTYLSYAEIESSANTDNLKHLSKRKMQGLWGKRLSGQWGKRSESDSDELYQRILRELYYTARRNQLAHPNYLADNDLNPLTVEQLIAQRTMWNDEHENTAENMS